MLSSLSWRLFFSFFLLLQAAFPIPICDWMDDQVYHTLDFHSITVTIDSLTQKTQSIIFLHSNNLVTEVPISFLDTDYFRLKLTGRHRIPRKWCSVASINCSMPKECSGVMEEKLEQFEVLPIECTKDTTQQLRHFRFSSRSVFKDTKGNDIAKEKYHPLPESNYQVVSNWQNCNNSFLFQRSTKKSEVFEAMNLKDWMEGNPNIPKWQVSIESNKYFVVRKPDTRNTNKQQLQSIPMGFIHLNYVYLFDQVYEFVYIFVASPNLKIGTGMKIRIELTKAIRLSEFFICNERNITDTSSSQPSSKSHTVLLIAIASVMIIAFLLAIIMAIINTFRRNHVSHMNFKAANRAKKQSKSLRSKKPLRPVNYTRTNFPSKTNSSSLSSTESPHKGLANPRKMFKAKLPRYK